MKVFLSSTVKDLELYRAEVIRRLRRLADVEFVSAEDFGARDRPPKDVALSAAVSCDLFVGLLGHLYGYVPAGDEKSIAEQEYDAAAAAGRPRLMFVAPDSLPVSVASLRADSSPERQEAFRERVQRETVTASGWSSPEELAASVVAAVYNWLTDPGARSAVPSAVPGRIITFYSYKGGTGRTMALANVAWILASRGKRVLTIDWDLEAPGLHRYFAPFLEDRELATTPGLIDFLNDFVVGAGTHADVPGGRWFEPFARITRYARSLDWEFPGEGTVDIVPAGRQGASYAASVTTFDWGRFYEQLGGGIFLEAVKQHVRAEYDYVLIDSRTGVSESAGICTIQMPDDLVVCFTLNTQSIRGASATAESAFRQRFTPERAPGVRVWPVPTRVELAERDRLERSRSEVRTRFRKFLHHLKPGDRAEYWGAVEVLYHPYFAYDEVLAVLAERRQQTGTLLQSFEQLTRFLTDGDVTSLGDVGAGRQGAALAAYGEAQSGPFYISYNHKDVDVAVEVAAALREHFGDEAVLWDRDLLRAGDPWGQVLAAAINRAQAVLALVSRHYVTGAHSAPEAEYVLGRGLRVVPVLLPGTSWADLAAHGGPLASLRNAHGLVLRSEDGTLSEADLTQLAGLLRDLPPKSRVPTPTVDADDPLRGQFGGSSTRDNFAITGSVKALRDDWFEIELRVARTDGGLEGVGEVEFHLHPTFDPAIRRVTATDGVATLRLQAWGAFTVGAVVLRPFAQLEFDLSGLPDAPPVFAQR